MQRRIHMRPVRVTRIIHGKAYSTATATLLAGDAEDWDSATRLLYATHNGRFFVVQRETDNSEEDTIEPLDRPEAADMFLEMEENGLTEVPFEDYFPDFVEDA